MSPLLSIEHLSIRFGENAVVRDVSLAVAKGEIVAIVGESGSGKSLTAQAVLQLLPGNAVVSGSVTLEDDAANLLQVDVRSISAIRGKRVGMIFQEPMTALNPLHTIDRQIIEPYLVHRCAAARDGTLRGLTRSSAKAQARLRELYDVVGLSQLAERGKLYPHQLSGGERQRAMIAMAIANDPELLIADEPTTALDVTLQHQILMLLKQLQRERQMGMIFITHDLLAVREIADRVIVMRGGAIVEAQATEALFANPQHDYTKMLLAAVPGGRPQPIAADAPVVMSAQKLGVRFAVKSAVLRRTLRHITAVEEVRFTLRAGETLGVVGESGSGKSTLANALLRLVPSEGPVVFLGRRIDGLSTREVRPFRADMQLVFQDPYGSLNPRMTVGEIVAEGLKIHGGGTAPTPPRACAAARAGGATRLDQAPVEEGQENSLPLRGEEYSERVDAILREVGLDPVMKHRYPHEFSGGQRQRIAIARAMILKPRLVILDEPTSALDVSVQRQVLELLKKLQREYAIAYVFISHDLRVVRSVAHQVLVLKRGQVVEQGTADAVFERPQAEYTKALLVNAR